MTSPGARQRSRREQYRQPRSRRELVTAVAVGAGIVAGTVFMIWILRPGGVADRQPRASWLIGLAIAAVLTAAYAVLRPASKIRRDRRVVLGVWVVAIAAVAVVAAMVWPDGIVRTITPPPTFATTPTTKAGATTTTKAAATTTAGGTPTTTAAATTTSTP